MEDWIRPLEYLSQDARLGLMLLKMVLASVTAMDTELIVQVQDLTYKSEERLQKLTKSCQVTLETSWLEK